MENQIEKVIQFLVCPQKDFIDKIEKGKRKPNKLHIGYQGAIKLRGEEEKKEPDFFIETVIRMFDEKIEGSEKIYVIIDEDWHPRSCPEFEVFNPHCVKGTDGARLPGKLEEFRRHPRTRIIRANSINVASSLNYKKILEEVCGETRLSNIRVGVFGVWTHVKVEYLMFNLHTLPPKFFFTQMAVCEPLCASPQREFHNLAIKKFRNDFKTNIYDNIDQYCSEWLGLNPEKFDKNLDRHHEESNADEIENEDTVN
jgi:nicotinamidase-related amidase